MQQVATKANVLLVDDEENLRKTLALNFELEGYTVTTANNGSQALKAVANEHFDIIVLDVMMPEIDGLTVLESLRVKNIETPVLILSAQNTSSDKILGLKKGGDDYLGKPFNIEELLLRVEKLITKNKKLEYREALLEGYEFSGNKINFNTHKAQTWSGEEIILSKKEIELLKLFISEKNNIVKREKILQVVWGYKVFPTTRTIDNFILSFRKYFERNSHQPKHFITIRSIGYQYVE